MPSPTYSGFVIDHSADLDPYLHHARPDAIPSHHPADRSSKVACPPPTSEGMAGAVSGVHSGPHSAELIEIASVRRPEYF